MNEQNYPFKILVVDDEPNNLNLMQQILKDHYELVFARNGSIALDMVEKHNPDLILLDIMMPDMDGYQVCEKLKTRSITADIPVIFVTAMDSIEDEEKGFNMGAVDYIAKPVKPRIVTARVAIHLALAHQKKACNEEVKIRTNQLEHSHLETLLALMRAAKLKDNETANHTLRVGLISYLIARELGYNYHRSYQVFLAAPLHDIGKIGVKDEILGFKGNLREHPDKWELMRAHTRYGADIIGTDTGSDILDMAYNVAMYHHEKIDGSGYPEGLPGDQIPQEAQVVATADMIDAMLDPTRPYRTKPIPEEKVKQFLQEDRGTKMQEEVIDAAFTQWDNIMLAEELFPNEQPVPLEKFSRFRDHELGEIISKILETRQVVI